MKLTRGEIFIITILSICSVVLVCPLYGWDIRLMRLATTILGGLVVFYFILN